MSNPISLQALERKFLPVLGVICTAFLLISPIYAQDDYESQGAPPPPPDQMAPPPDETNAPQDNGATNDSGASFQTFYDSLQSQGNWIQTGDYGYVWQPDVDDPDWAPYTDGSWAYTDNGWTWVSDEPWGWATYHYGRWVNLDGTGWCWVPGYTWAPAWVSWRYGDGYCGWAPLPPDSFVGIDYGDGGFFVGIGFHIGGDCDDFYGIGPGCYHFVPIHCLGHRNYYHGHDYVDPHANYAIINHTTNVTNINVNRHDSTGGEFARSQVTIGGPSLAQVNAVAETPVPRVNLVRTNEPGGGGSLSEHSLTLYAPHFNPGTRETARPGNIAGSIGTATVNRGLDITRPLTVNSRVPMRMASPAQIEQARLAQSQAPARAKVATANMQINPVLNAPLTSLKPIMPEQTPEAAHAVTAPSSRTISETPGATVQHTYSGQGEGYGQSTPSAPGYSSTPPHSSGYGSPYAPAPSHTTSGGGAPTYYHSGPSGGYHSGGGNGGGGGRDVRTVTTDYC
ncbi:MAG: hypothetical protein LV479_00055 [Methylacidiphilales bacterium]|nr:hypothetical protein [Candidatus Methylacidiphilales bacterium]